LAVLALGVRYHFRIVVNPDDLCAGSLGQFLCDDTGPAAYVKDPLGAQQVGPPVEVCPGCAGPACLAGKLLVPLGRGHFGGHFSPIEDRFNT
jgi:hypothetical protein